MKLLAAAVQFAASSSKDENLTKAKRWVREACERGARLVALPELFSWRGGKSDEQAAAELIPGPTSEEMARLARSLGIYLVCGSFLEKAPDDQKVWNTSLLISPEGKILARYRKVHLFDVSLPDGRVIRESETRKTGEGAVVAETEYGAVGLSICYDLRFPELYRQLTLKGATIIAVPSAFTFWTGTAHWEILLRARAIENQVYLVAPDQNGRDGTGILDYGNSMIVDPWGRVLARAQDCEGAIVAELDLADQERVRQSLPCLKHIRMIQ
jgi:predicted amidohydrolase